MHCLQVLDFWPLQEYFGLSESTFVPCDNKRHLEMKEHRRREYGRRGGRKEEDESRRVGERKGLRHYIDWWDSLVCNPRIHNACISFMASLCVLTLRDHLSHSAYFTPWCLDILKLPILYQLLHLQYWGVQSGCTQRWTTSEPKHEVFPTDRPQHMSPGANLLASACVFSLKE